VLLGDREFCSVKLGSWAEQRAYFCLRLKKNEFVQLEGEIWLLEQLGLVPGMQLYLDGVSVTKQKDLVSSMLRASGNVNIRWTPDEGWFIMTNLPDLESAILSYKKRFGIEEMFRDFKSGGYKLEGTNVTGERLVVMVLLIAIAIQLPQCREEKSS